MYYTVLIVDDELIIRQGIEYMLNWEEEGFQIIGKAKNGEEALQIIEARHPDIVITDIEMPNMNGLELAEIIAKQHPEIQMIMLSAHQNFEYVRPSFSLGAVDYMLKSALSSEELRKTLKKSIKGLAKQTNLSDAGFSQKISRYLSGYDQEFSYKEFHIEFPVHVFILGKSEEKKDGEEKLQRLNEILRSSPFAKGHTSGFLLEELYPAFLVETAYKDRCVQFLQTKAESEKTCFFISRPVESLSDLKTTQQKLCDQRNASLFYASNATMIDENNLESFPLPKAKALDSYEMNLKKSDFKAAFEILEQYAHDALQAHMEESRLKSLVVNAIYRFVNILEEYRLDKDHIRYFKLHCYSLIHNAKSAQDFQTQLHTLLADAKIIVQEYHVQESRDEISEMMNYIQNHYNEPLQLQTLVDRFGFSYAYLSSLFSEKSSETFSEYLNRIRIEKACALLTSTDQSITAIATETGYTDSSYFSRVFKKQTGMTPRTYRRRNS